MVPNPFIRTKIERNKTVTNSDLNQIWNIRISFQKILTLINDEWADKQIIRHRHRSHLQVKGFATPFIIPKINRSFVSENPRRIVTNQQNHIFDTRPNWRINVVINEFIIPQNPTPEKRNPRIIRIKKIPTKFKIGGLIQSNQRSKP